jgi:hypothetical protein
MTARARAGCDRRATQAARLGLVAAASVFLLTGCGLFASAPSPAHHGRSGLASPGPVSVQGNGPTAAQGLGGSVGVVVDNDAYARPQSGLEHASLVFEAPAEGGITRFLALFWQQGAAQVGPVRSTRIYFDQLAQAYGVPLAHAGGNVDALAAVKTLHLENIDEIWTPGAAQFFWRSTSRQAPHNLYTSTALLVKAVRSLGLALGPIPTWPVATPDGGASADALSIDFSGVEHVRWRYQDGMYTRYEGASPDDTLGGAPIRARAVLVLFVAEAPDPDPYTPGSIKLLMTGAGTGELAAGGRVVAVRWRREAGAPFEILALGGGAQAMPAPPLWVELVPTGTPVTPRA